MAQAPVYNPEISDISNNDEVDGYLIDGHDNTFGSSFNAANFGDGDLNGSTDLGKIDIDKTLVNLFANVGNKLAKENPNYNELINLLTIYNSTYYRQKLSFFLKDDYKTITQEKLDRLLRKISDDMFNPSSEGLIKTFDISACAMDIEIKDDIDVYFSKIVNEFDSVVKDLFKADAELTNKIMAFESMSKSVECLHNLSKNDTTKDLYRSLANYMRNFYEESSIEESFKKLMTVYSRFLKYRSFMKLKLAAEGDDAEHKLPLCSVCIDRPVAFAFAPCGHTFCQSCSQRNVNICYICRLRITSKLKLFFS